MSNKLYLEYTEIKTGGEPESNEDWCSFSDTHIDWKLDKCYSEESKGRCCWCRREFTCSFDVKKDEYVHVLYVRYTTGSTFGTVYGAWCIEGVYSTFEEAAQIQEAIESDARISYRDEKSVRKYKSNDGYKEWEGYFERFESCGIYGMKVY